MEGQEACMQHFRSLGTSALALGLLAASPPPQDELWNGRDFAGFYTFLKNSGKNNDPDHVFRVEDGLIHVSGKEYGYLATEREYDHYLLRVEFKWGEGT